VNQITPRRCIILPFTSDAMKSIRQIRDIPNFQQPCNQFLLVSAWSKKVQIGWNSSALSIVSFASYEHRFGDFRNHRVNFVPPNDIDPIQVSARSRCTKPLQDVTRTSIPIKGTVSSLSAMHPTGKCVDVAAEK
jgi:hypothetical protein